MNTTETIARINGVPLHAEDETLDAATLRQRACTELLRQAAQRTGLLAVGDAPVLDGVISDAASAAIERLLDQQLALEEPSEDACRRHYAAHPTAFTQGERAMLRHVLFAVTEGVDVNALRSRAEALLVELRCADPESAAFAEAAAKFSNCPSGQSGGELGTLTREDCAPEFAREVFGNDAIGILPRLVHSRFGFHVIEVRSREAAPLPPFETVRATVAHTLRQQAWINALRHYLQTLADEAEIVGVDLNSED